MIYVCLTTHNHDATVGLVLWKVRQVFHEYPREYQILVVDDASTDGTTRTLETYQRALPMTVVRHAQRTGYAASVEALLRMALERTDRPRRDLALTVPADFSASPAVVPELLKRFESGADLVIGEGAARDPSLRMRLIRLSAPWLLRPRASVPAVKDPTSGVYAMRLVTLKRVVDQAEGRLFHTEGLAANAELVARLARAARQMTTVAVPAPRHMMRASPPEGALAAAVNLFRAGRRLHLPAATGDPRES